MTPSTEIRAASGSADAFRAVAEAMGTAPDDRTADEWAVLELAHAEAERAVEAGHGFGDVWMGDAWADLGGQGDLFEPEPAPRPADPVERERQAEARTAAAMTRHGREALAVWRAVAWSVLKRYATEHVTFTADDLWQDRAMPEPPAGTSRRVLGILVREAQRAGLIEDSGQVRRVASSNGGRKTVWRSRIVGV